MRLSLFKIIGLGVMTFMTVLASQAQDVTEKKKLGENDEIIIMKKDGKDVKVTLEIKDGEVKINGKPLDEYNNDNLVIIQRKNNRLARVTAPRPPVSPFRGGTWNYNGNPDLENLLNNSNKPFLGVTSETASNGVEITGVTRGSAAEKSGLKEGDVIAKVNDIKIEKPEDLSRAIGKYKPEDKVDITYRRDKKELKASVILGKRAGGSFAETFDMNKNFNFDLTSPEGLNLFMGNSPKLGIKAQDTDDGKGVKVLGIDDASTADKAGIKEGDIINEFDGKAVNSAMELVAAARAAKDKNSIKVKLNRDGKLQEVEIKVPRKLKTANL